MNARKDRTDASKCGKRCMQCMQIYRIEIVEDRKCALKSLFMLVVKWSAFSALKKLFNFFVYDFIYRQTRHKKEKTYL